MVMTDAFWQKVGIVVGLGFLLAEAGWLPVDSITNRDTTDITCKNNARAVVGDASGDIHVVWRGRRAGVFQVWYSRWDAGTRTWSADTVLSNDVSDAGDPAIACDSSGNLYVAWITAGVLQLKRRDGVTGLWLPAETLVGNPYDQVVSITVDRNGVQHLVWARLVVGAIRICYVFRGEQGWSRVDTVAEESHYMNVPCIAWLPPENLMVVWRQNIGNQRGVVSRRRVNGEWARAETVFSGGGDTTAPCVVGAGDTFHVVWVADNNAVFYRGRGRDGWGDTLRLSVWAYGKRCPSIVGDGEGNLHLAWVAEDTTPQRFRQVCYRKRVAGGGWGNIYTLTTGGNDRDRVSIAAQPGKVQVAWSEWRGTPATPAIRLRRSEFFHDVGVMRIEQPGDTVDSMAAVCPIVWLGNYGDFTERLGEVCFRIGEFIQWRQFDSIAPGESIQVAFDTVFVYGRGIVTVACSVRVADDVNAGNDVMRRSLFVRVRDVVLESIISPRGRVEAESVRPIVRVCNRGNAPASFPLCCSIFALPQREPVADTTISLILGAGVTSNVAFGVPILDPGSYLVRVRADLPGDMHSENDTISGEFVVVCHDVGVRRIVWPVGQVDSGDGGEPQVTVENLGTEAESFLVVLRIGSGYVDSASVFLTAGDSSRVSFDFWEASGRGDVPVCCSTVLVGDRTPENDTALGTVFVRVRDVVIARIVRPGEVTTPGELRPVGLIFNYGNEAVWFSVWCEIEDSTGIMVYGSAARVFLGSGDSSVVSFRLWRAGGGFYRIKMGTELTGDMHPDNDTLSKWFRVARRDVAVEEIRSPADTVQAGVIQPEVVVANRGEEPAQFYVYFAAFADDSLEEWTDSVLVFLEVGADSVVRFGEWQAVPGEYRLVARVVLAGDENPGNDSVFSRVFVEAPLSRHWQELPSVPTGYRRLPVRSGGAMVSTGQGIFVLKGGGTDEFYFYAPNDNHWEGRAPMPRGLSRRRPKGGATLVWDGGNRIYALKGSNTREVWGYDIPGDSWFSLPSLPASLAPVRYGSGLVFLSAATGSRIFCLKGSGTNEFLVYWFGQREWHARRPVPSAEKYRPVRKGSCLVKLGNRVFLLKGQVNEFYEYIVERDTWRSCASLPFHGQSGWRRCKEGAALTSDGVRFIYAFKGGRSLAFWRYDVLLDSWTEQEPIPLGKGRRRVGGGGALAFYNGRVYALKGGGCWEFWCYEPETTVSPAGIVRRGVTAPPAVGRVGVGKSELKTVFDIIGRRVNCTTLKPGVYFFWVPGEIRPWRKVVVPRSGKRLN